MRGAALSNFVHKGLEGALSTKLCPVFFWKFFVTFFKKFAPRRAAEMFGTSAFPTAKCFTVPSPLHVYIWVDKIPLPPSLFPLVPLQNETKTNFFHVNSCVLTFLKTMRKRQILVSRISMSTFKTFFVLLITVNSKSKQ